MSEIQVQEKQVRSPDMTVFSNWLDSDSLLCLQNDAKSIEKAEEAKLKAKYPQVARPGPQFLQKRLTKGVSLEHISPERYPHADLLSL